MAVMHDLSHPVFTDVLLNEFLLLKEMVGSGYDNSLHLVSDNWLS